MTRHPLHAAAHTHRTPSQVEVRPFHAHALAASQSRAYGHEKPRLERMSTESPQQPTHLPCIKHLRLITAQMGQSDSSEAHIVVCDSFTVGESEHGPKYGPCLACGTRMVESGQPVLDLRCGDGLQFHHAPFRLDMASPRALIAHSRALAQAYATWPPHLLRKLSDQHFQPPNPTYGYQHLHSRHVWVFSPTGKDNP